MSPMYSVLSDVTQHFVLDKVLEIIQIILFGFRTILNFFFNTILTTIKISLFLYFSFLKPFSR